MSPNNTTELPRCPICRVLTSRFNCHRHNCPGKSQSTDSRTTSRDALWKLLPGMLIWNVIGRHVAYRSARRAWTASGKTWDLPKPGRITIRDLLAIPYGSHDRQ